MKKIIFSLLAFALVIPSAFANTKVPAKDVTVDASVFTKNLNSSDIDVQKALVTIDQLSTSGSGNPAGVDTQYQINNNGVFGGGNMYNVGGNVGINSTSPGAQLDVAGGVRVTGFQMNVGSSLANKVFTSDASGNATWQTFPSGSGTVNPGFTGQFSVYAEDGTAVSTQSSLTLNANGNVGVGTSDASQTLEVNGSAKSALFIGPGAIGTLTANTIPKAGSFHDLADSVITQVGNNIGIGSATPTSKLSVGGTLFTPTAIIGTLSGLLKGTSGTVSAATSGTDYAPATSGSSILMGNGAGGFNNAVAGTNYEVPLTFSTGLTRATNTVVVNNSQNIVQLSNLASNGVVTTTGGNGTLTVVPTSNFTGLWNQGSVGINTTVPVGIGSTNPGQSLDVVGIGRFTGGVQSNGTSGSAFNIAGPNGIQIDGANSTVTAPKLTITSNVGVGTTTPSSLLDVAGQAQMTGFKLTTTPTSGYILTSNGVGVGTWAPAPASGGTPGGSTGQLQYNNAGVFGGISGSGTASGNLGIGSVNPEYGLVVGANGAKFVGSGPFTVIGANMGIGSTTPGKELDVQGTVRALFFSGDGSGLTGVGGSVANPSASVGLTAVNGSATSAIRSDGAPALSQSIAPTWTGIHTFTNATNSALFTGGNVGIGSSSPGKLLDVQGTIRSLFFNNMAITAPASSSTLAVANGKTFTVSKTLTLDGTDSTTMTFPSTTATVARTDAGQTFTGVNNFSSNVGVGSATPGKELDVQGTVRALFFSGNGSALTGISGVISGLTTGTIPKAASSSTITNSIITEASGNIGISSATPGSTLDVQGTVRALSFTQTGTSANTFTGTPTFSNATYSALFTGGNVGIGSSAPGRPLQVNGNVGMGTTDATFYNLKVNGSITYDHQYTNANVGIGTTTINWNNGNMQNVGLGTSSGAYLAFTDPTAGVSHIELKLIQDGTGSRTIAFWPTKVKWVGGTIPTLSTTAAAIDFLNCSYDGNYYCQVTKGYQ